MCTMTYIPQEEGKFILTHSRDESIRRGIASPPIKRMIGGIKHLFPVDPVGMGTWIGVSEYGRVAGLVNGAKKEHIHKPPYKHSRGRIILDFFTYPDFSGFIDNYSFDDLEPFTLIVFENGKIYEAILDGEGILKRELQPDKPFVYSSSSLYTEKSKHKRKVKFFNWYLQDMEKDQKSIFEFHKENLFDNEPDKSKVPGDHILKTVSITSVVNMTNEIDMNYLDLVNDIGFRNNLRLNPSFSQNLN